MQLLTLVSSNTTFFHILFFLCFVFLCLQKYFCGNAMRYGFLLSRKNLVLKSFQHSRSKMYFHDAIWNQKHFYWQFMVLLLERHKQNHQIYSKMFWNSKDYFDHFRLYYMKQMTFTCHSKKKVVRHHNEQENL